METTSHPLIWMDRVDYDLMLVVDCRQNSIAVNFKGKIHKYQFEESITVDDYDNFRKNTIESLIGKEAIEIN